MRTDAKRIDRYKKKIRGLILPGQAAEFGTEVERQVRIEREVKKMLEDNGVQPIFNHFYMVFAKKIVGLTEKHAAETAYRESDIAIREWWLRGLDRVVLRQIRHYYLPRVEIPEVLFRLDISLLDGTDVLE